MRIMKLFAFHILLSIRGMILCISKLFALMSLLTWLCTLYIKEISGVPLTAKVMLATLGIIFTLVYWFFDDLIFHLKPEHIDLTLYR